MSGAPPSPVAKLGAWLAFVVPLALVIGRLSGEGHWTDDLPAVRALGLVQVGAEGLVSSALASVWAAVPVGDRLFRLGLFSAVLTGCGGLLTYNLCFGMIDRQLTPSARALTALAAAWVAALGPSWQQRGLGVGRGALVECLLLLAVHSVRRPGNPNFWYTQALLIGLLLGEERAVVPAVIAVALVSAITKQRSASGREILGAFSTLALTVLIVFTPSLVEALGGPNGFRLGFELDLPASRALMGEPVLAEIGWYTGGLALFELTACLLNGTGLLWAGPVVLVFCSLLPGGHISGAAAVSIVSALGGCGFVRLIAWLFERQIAFARPALGLCALLHLSVVLLAAEDGRRAVERQSVNGTRAWSRAAFDQLPPRSLLLVSSPDAVWRLWAAQAIEGTRPDVVIVPAPLLTRGSMARHMLQVEPQLNRVIRDLAVSEVAGEYALSEIADVRPVRVELDPKWTPRVLTHLVSDGLWFRLAPEALGRTDRAIGAKTLTTALERVLSTSRNWKGRDEATIARLVDDAFAHAVVAAALGESTTANGVLRDLRRLAPDDPRWGALATDLEERPRGFSDLRGLALRR